MARALCSWSSIPSVATANLLHFPQKKAKSTLVNQRAFVCVAQRKFPHTLCLYQIRLIPFYLAFGRVELDDILLCEISRDNAKFHTTLSRIVIFYVIKAQVFKRIWY